MSGSGARLLDGFVDGTQGDAPVLSNRAYYSTEFTELERDRLWRKVWQVVCRADELANVGDFIEYRVADLSILVVRSDEETIKAFHNSCLHRGTLLREGAGNTLELRCRYHAWCWDLHGNNVEVIDPHHYDPATITPDCLRLPECSVDSWGGFVFINLDADPVPLLEYLKPLPEELERFELEKMSLVRCRTTVIPVNWKTALEAFLEGYHVVGVHPQMLTFFDDTTWAYNQYGMHSVSYVSPGAFGTPSGRLGDAVKPDRQEILVAMVEEFAGADLFTDEELEALNALLAGGLEIPEGQSVNEFFAQLRRLWAGMQGVDLSRFNDNDVMEGKAWNVFPNFTMPINAGSCFFFCPRPNGLDPESCIFDIWSLEQLADGAQRLVEREFVPDFRAHDWGHIVSQDLVNIPIVQRGMHMGDRRLLSGYHDSNIRNFHRTLLELLEIEG